MCGVSGIGKTTIAEAVYNGILSSFNKHSFISDVSKQAKQCIGLVSLQNRLLKDMFNRDSDIRHCGKGKILIKHRLCKEKVLLVLDDVDNKEQVDALASELNWFGPGSRVIITTIDEHILKVTKVDKDKVYWVEELNHEESLQLFSLHAFSMDEPPRDYMQRSRDMIKYLGGLPASLEVLGLGSDDNKRFKIEEIKTATKNFDESLAIGVGGFGKVYKGELKDGTMAAIKHAHLQSKSGQGRAEFLKEIEMLSKIWHEHVVSMIGFCDEENEMILVYEYNANGNLKNHLFRWNYLTWKQKLEICLGAARGLHYLHTWGENGIIHRDVKPSNILLDEKFLAKISDFGISLTDPPALSHHTHHHVHSVKGTTGYLDPEYMGGGELTKKYDVYSFGVLLLEVVNSHPLFNSNLLEEELYIPTRLECPLHLLRLERSLNFYVDEEGNYCPESFEKFKEIADKCTGFMRKNWGFMGKNRPIMEEVLQDLEYVLQLHEAWLRTNSGVE
ncbi:probable receptor-like protein kinase At1g30570 [Telopea speciosissima]|uniref:probable receptor-like protein kinase At1g30570 n=1 Tax=Telopea speciosissima TaxID=54955 RepID=UPI001CC4BE44|nr:probable receptor-like protein kinase At1g30570 [Telopea speciosissima]